MSTDALRLTDAEKVAGRWTAVLGRVSSERQAGNGESGSVLGQVRDCVRVCGEQGWRYAIYTDIGSGADPNRPAWLALQADIEAGRVARVVCYDADRLSRDVADALAFFKLCKARGVELWEPGQRVTSRLLYGIKSLLSEDERERIATRTKAGRVRLAEAGLYLQVVKARPPFGYRVLDKTPQLPQRLEIVPEKAAVYRRAVEMIFGDHSLNSIARRFNEEGVPAPTADYQDGNEEHRTRIGAKPPGNRWELAGHMEGVEVWTRPPYTPSGDWYRQVVRRILADPTYCGRRVVRVNLGTKEAPDFRDFPVKQHVDVDGRPVEIVPALLDPDTWQRLQERLQRRAPRSDAKRFYLLNGLIRCRCGQSVYGRQLRGKSGKVYEHYRCGGMGQRQTPDGRHRTLCKQSVASGPWVESEVRRIVVEGLSNSPDVAQALRVRAGKSAVDQRDLDALEKTRRTIAELKRQEATAKERFLTASHLLTEADLDAVLSRLRAERQELSAQQAKLEVRVADGRFYDERAKAVLRTVEELKPRLRFLSPKDWRVLLQAAGAQIVLDGDHVEFRCALFPGVAGNERPSPRRCRVDRSQG